MKPKYLEKHNYKKYKDYCSYKCINIVFEQNDKEDNEKAVLRGMYKGYLYGMKLFDALLKRNRNIKNFEIYNLLKYHKSHGTTLFGEDKAILDIMNIMCDDFPNKGTDNF